MVLIDSSCWVHYFRSRGDARVRDRVSSLLRKDEGVWCAMVRLELWNGVGSESDRTILREHEIWLPELIASQCRKTGKTAPANDVLIAACARHYEVALEYTDAH